MRLWAPSDGVAPRTRQVMGILEVMSVVALVLLTVTRQFTAGWAVIVLGVGLVAGVVRWAIKDEGEVRMEAAASEAVELNPLHEDDFG